MGQIIILLLFALFVGGGCELLNWLSRKNCETLQTLLTMLWVVTILTFIIGPLSDGKFAQAAGFFLTAAGSRFIIYWFRER